MSSIAVALIVASAFTHAAWNLVGKRRCPSPAFFLVANAAGALCLSPVLVYFREQLPLVPGSVWMLVALTGLLQALYFTGLGWAYRSGDMSLVYPLARALPVLLVYLTTLAVGKGREVGWLGAAGMGFVALGCLVLPVRRLREFRPGVYLRACCLFALVAAIGTSGYSMIDDEALRRLRGLGCGGFTPLRSTLVYIALESISTLVWLGCLVLLRATERGRLVEVLRGSRWQAAAAGLAIYATYGLVLASMAFVENVSYVVAFRQLSVPIGAAMGMAVLKEPRYTPKLVGIAVVSAGLVMVGCG